jgi:glycosyltransferase involved in cell wall biosynthesis
MKILALEPYYGGSHRAFLDGWVSHSRHNWTVLGLPPRKWKWRMRHAAVTLADEVMKLRRQGEQWDAVFCSDMLNLAEFKGLVDPPVGQLPTIVYFHENQLTYPCQVEDERDVHFGLTNFTTALAADEVWFNSEFHRAEFYAALEKLLRKMPDHQLLDQLEMVKSKSIVRSPGIEAMPQRGARRPGPPRILWVARWEHDKGPAPFIDAMETLSTRGLDFRLNMIGQQFSRVPKIFDSAKERLAKHIDKWGYLENRSDYVQTLLDSDIVVSTADHEFFGIAIVEAIAAGNWPVLPDRLAYPEILSAGRIKNPTRFFYDGTQESLIKTLVGLLPLVESGQLWNPDAPRLSETMREFEWDARVTQLDVDLEHMAKREAGQTR